MLIKTNFLGTYENIMYFLTKSVRQSYQRTLSFHYRNSVMLHESEKLPGEKFAALLQIRRIQ